MKNSEHQKPDCAPNDMIKENNIHWLLYSVEVCHSVRAYIYIYIYI